MKNLYLITCLLNILSSPVLGFEYFQGSYADALRKAKAENKNIFLYFTADWCGPCRYMDKYVFSDGTISSYAKQNYVSLKIDVDTKDGKILHFKYLSGSGGVPDFYVITPGEEIIKKKIGGMNIGQLKSFLINREKKQIPSKVLSDSVALTRIEKVNRRSDSLQAVLASLNKSNSDGMIAQPIQKAKPDSVAGRLYEQQLDKDWPKFARFMMSSSMSLWKPAIKIGFNMSTMSHSIASVKPIPGYYAGMFYDFTSEKGRLLFQPGLMFNSKGGSVSGTTTRFHYLEMPLAISYRVGRHNLLNLGRQALRFNLIPYGALSLGTTQERAKDSPTINSIRNIKPFDYGVKGGFSFALGSFEPFIGYDIGLANISENSSYKLSNRTYYLSFALIAGK